MINSFVRSLPETFEIPENNDGSAVAAVNLGAPYNTILIECADAQYIPITTTVGAWVGYTGSAAETLVALHALDDPSAIWAGGNLPTSGNFGFALTNARGVWRVRLILSNDSTGGGTDFTIRGLERGA